MREEGEECDDAPLLCSLELQLPEDDDLFSFSVPGHPDSSPFFELSVKRKNSGQMRRNATRSVGEVGRKSERMLDDDDVAEELLIKDITSLLETAKGQRSPFTYLV